MMRVIRSILDYIVRGVVVAAAVFVLAVIVSFITPLEQLDAYFKEYPQPYTAITLGMLIAGFVLLWYTWSVAIFGHRQAARLTASFREVKDAFRAGDWLLDPQWRPICLGLIGALLAATGLFGYLIVSGPPTLKVIAGGALAYGLARTAWGFWKA